VKEFVEWFSDRFDLNEEIAIDNLKSLKDTKMIFTDPITSQFKEEKDLIFLQEKDFYDFQQKHFDHYHLNQLMISNQFLLIRLFKKKKIFFFFLFSFFFLLCREFHSFPLISHHTHPPQSLSFSFLLTPSHTQISLHLLHPAPLRLVLVFNPREFLNANIKSENGRPSPINNTA
jgi:hypothetical protein